MFTSAFLITHTAAARLDLLRHVAAAANTKKPLH